MTQITYSPRVDKLNLLLKSGQNLYHTQDLALLWGTLNRNSLYTTIKRYVKKGILIKITKGLYSKIPINEVNIYALGAALIHKYCYLSCETVLAQKGIINQTVSAVTFVSSISLKVKFNDTVYIYRRMNAEKLLDPTGIEKMDGYFVASKERAVSDMLYFNPKYYFDNNQI